jgi:hypothetical protein
MFRRITLNAFAAVSMIALVVSLGVVGASMVPPAKATTLIAVAVSEPTGGNASCRSPGWPYYEQSCQFDLRTLDSESRTVRLIALR